MACGFPGNSDVYGIGIRIGYYTQTLAVWFSNYFFYREARVLRAANHLFLIALVIVGFIYTYNAPTIYVIEAFLLLQIGLCIAFVSIMENSRFSSRYMRTSGQRLAVRTVIMNAGLLFNVCFWWRGLDVMLPTPCDDNGMIDNRGQSHSTYACYAFRADIYAWMRTLMKILSLAALGWTTLVTTSRDAGEMVQWHWMRRARAEFVSFDPEKEDLETIILKSKATPPEDVEKSCPNKQTQKISGAPEPSDTVQQPTSSEVSKTSVKQVANSKTKQANQKPKEVLHKASEIRYAGIRDAEVYLDSIFSIYTKNTNRPGRRRVLHLFRGRMYIYIPRIPHHHDPDSARYARCVWTTIKSTWTNKPSMGLRWRLALHMSALGQHPPWRWPRFLHHMYEVNERQEPPNWRLLAIASDIQLSQIPLTISPKVWTFMAIDKLLIIIALIVQVELTIAWNHISGLQNLNTLGQLIPFILGVGGLLKVFWGKWCMVRKGFKESPKAESRHPGDYEAAMGRYLKWKEKVQPGVMTPLNEPEMTNRLV